MVPKVSIIVCAYNNKNIIGSCLNSISKQSYKNFRAYVIDDNSSDGTFDYIKERYPWIVFQNKKENSGPSISRNIGVSISNSDYIAFLDSDVELGKDWLKECVKLMDSNKKIGICGSKLLYKSSKNKINSIGGAISRIGIGSDIAKGENDKFFDKNKILFACSAAILVRRSMLQKIGCFDNTFFYSYEDTDLGWRANLAGYDVIFNPKAIAYHNLNETIKHITEKVCFHSTKNRVRMLIKNYELHNLAIYLPILILASFFDILFRKYKIAKVKGLVWNFLNIKDTLLERKNVQKHRNLKDKFLFNMFKKGWF